MISWWRSCVTRGDLLVTSLSLSCDPLWRHRSVCSSSLTEAPGQRINLGENFVSCRTTLTLSWKRTKFDTASHMSLWSKRTYVTLKQENVCHPETREHTDNIRKQRCQTETKNVLYNGASALSARREKMMMSRDWFILSYIETLDWLSIFYFVFVYFYINIMIYWTFY